MAKPRTSRSKTRRRVAVVTGTRAEFGLLVPVMRAIQKRSDLELLVVAGGAHLLPPARTIREVEAQFTVAATVPMQRPGRTGRDADAEALGRGVSGFAKAFAKLKPDWVVVLGDRIEALAAAAAASVAGIGVCHIHGGDRAEGIADEAMRHAITKLAHLHCTATRLSAERIVRMGERAEHVHVTGSPAIDGLDKVRPMSDRDARALGDPRSVVLLHPTGQADRDHAASVLASCFATKLWPAVFLDPNSDPGREVIVRQWAFMRDVNEARTITHLPRGAFLSLLARIARTQRGALIGNSSAGLIECAAMGVPAINIGPRQRGRERGRNVLTFAEDGRELPIPAFHRALNRVVRHAERASAFGPSELFGDGDAGPRIAAMLAKTDPRDPALLRKQNTY